MSIAICPLSSNPGELYCGNDTAKGEGTAGGFSWARWHQSRSDGRFRKTLIYPAAELGMPAIGQFGFVPEGKMQSGHPGHPAPCCTSAVIFAWPCLDSPLCLPPLNETAQSLKNIRPVLSRLHSGAASVGMHSVHV